MDFKNSNLNQNDFKDDFNEDEDFQPEPIVKEKRTPAVQQRTQLSVVQPGPMVGEGTALERYLATLSEKDRKKYLTLKEKNKQLREELVQQIRDSAVPEAYLQAVMWKCADVHHPDTLDFSMDLLAGFSDQLEALCRGFIEADRQRWTIQPQQSHANDDICYVLLRALGRSQVDIAAKLAVIEDCLTNGPRGVREAAVHALGDVGGAEAERLLRVFAKEDVDCLVRESAESLLSEWEN